MQNINKHRNKAENNVRDIFCTVILTKAVSQPANQSASQPDIHSSTNTKLTLNGK